MQFRFRFRSYRQGHYSALYSLELACFFARARRKCRGNLRFVHFNCIGDMLTSILADP